MRRPVVIVVGLAGVLAAGLVGWRVRTSLAEADEARRRDELFYAATWDLDHGEPGQALEKLNALAQLEPTRKALPKQLGRALVSNGRPVEALARLAEAKAAPGGADDAEAFEYTGVAQSQLGNLKEAIAALERAVELDGRRTSAWKRLAQTRLTAGDVEGAVGAWTKAIEASPAEAATTRLEARTLLSQAGKAEAAQFSEEGAP